MLYEMVIIYAACLVGFSKSLAKEVGPRGIRVNVVEPGFITTDMTAGMLIPFTASVHCKWLLLHSFDSAVVCAGMSPDALKHITSQTALRRLGRPADVASTVAYLCCDEASFITGSVLTVDGGLEL